jgi:hypothetical protein
MRGVTQILGLHFVLNQLWICWYILDNLLARLAQASVDRELLVRYLGSIWFLVRRHSLTRVHRMIVGVTIGRAGHSVCLWVWLVARSYSSLWTCLISVNRVLAAGSWSAMASTKLSSSTRHSHRRIVLILCNLVISLLVLECLSYEWFVFRVHEAGIASDLILCELIVGVESRGDAVVRGLAGVARMGALLIDLKLGVRELSRV